MFRFMLAARLLGAALIAVASLAIASPASAQSGTIRIQIIKAGFIIGMAGGSGTLNYQGKRYSLSIGGVSLGATIGASKAELVGQVYNLRRASDIAGIYTAAEAGVAVVGGRKVARLRNSKGVVLQVRGPQIGLEFAVDLSGLEIGLR